eukprot:CAMPEP_0177611664 /NCGR_PEP_ID=MMETSP0419_2-20121207/20654_1 /TAXON_ID=582737 /ORGANISM="Tetraselmis sp., Strain GSL018" /LENGTH=500 /DNA_ID=CAMNT_0019107493 /DNA_START=165 /DNA_END=1667 /DNA_ORIENTATION=-
MFCAISGHVPEEPVVSRSSGHLFEKRLILKHLETDPRCPVTGEELSKDDLLDLQTNKAVKPRTAPASSIPGLLGLFQNEWDALMLESHNLKQNLHKLRQELSHALYQHDASCRVIARLIKERDEARSALAQATRAAPADMENGKRPAESEDAAQEAKRAKSGITSEAEALMTETSAKLSKSRKKRTIPEGTAGQDDIEALALASSHPLHKTTKGGINHIAICPFVAGSKLLATAGNDGTVQVFDGDKGQVVGELAGHSKRVNNVAFVGGPDALITASADSTVRMWKGGDESFECVHVCKEHSQDVQGLTLHPTGKFFISASADATWAFYDVDTADCMLKVSDSNVTAPYTCASFHPDGLILGTGGTDNAVRIWEVRSSKNVATFDTHTGPITSLSFSENGYYLATSATDGVKLWDLRKLKNFKTLTPYDSDTTSCCAFDSSGYWLAVGGGDARVYGVKQDWKVVKTLPDVPSKGVLSLAWGELAKTIAVGASDHSLRIYS